MKGGSWDTSPSPPKAPLGQLKRSAPVGCGGILGLHPWMARQNPAAPLEFSDVTHGAGPVAGNCRAAPPLLTGEAETPDR
jgi:hypothetical protein